METGRLKQETTRNFCENSMSKVELNDKKEKKNILKEWEQFSCQTYSPNLFTIVLCTTNVIAVKDVTCGFKTTDQEEHQTPFQSKPTPDSWHRSGYYVLPVSNCLCAVATAACSLHRNPFCLALFKIGPA